MFEPPGEKTGTSCANDCHGDGRTAAPPRGLNGEGSTNTPGVGAHRAHTRVGSESSRDIECSECHVVPASVDSSGHIDPAPAEVTFGKLAAAQGASPEYSGTRCSGTYCHGATLYPGGTNTAPIWTKVGGNEAACGTCHGLPPGPPHVLADQCSGCHTIVDADRVFLEPQRHVNGVVDTNYEPECGDCHGSKSSQGPPPDTRGHTTSNFPGVGAHQSHLKASGWRATIKCSECHVVPQSIYDPGHFDSSLPAEITWGPTAHAHGATPHYDGTSCTGVYCHGGSTLSQGGTLTEPLWTKVDGSQAKCGSCHGKPPPLPHPPRNDCATCHPTIDSGGDITNPERHVDGVIDTDIAKLDCTSCHGSDGESAPPRDTLGNTSTESPSVGAHRAHLGQSTWHVPLQCSDCHKVPSTVLATGHLDTELPAELKWGKLATAKGATPTYDGVSCSSVYCHGGTLKGGTATQPVWTKLDGTQIKCGACHAMPPPDPHPQQSACWNCHTVAGPGPSGPVITDPSRHIDGVIQTL